MFYFKGLIYQEYYYVKTESLCSEVIYHDNYFVKIENMFKFVNLECLNLERVSLSDSSFKGLTRLQRLELIECDFENFKCKSFRNVPNLEILFIKKPFYFNLDANFQELSKLKWLNISNFSNLSLKHDNVEILEIELENNQNFEYSNVNFLPKLKALRLSSKSGIPQSINLNNDYFSCLESLFLDTLKISTLRISSMYLSNLKYLSFININIDSDGFCDILKGYRQLEKLEIVSFGNFFNKIPYDFFDDLENLTHFNLRLNRLIDINPKWFSHMPKLRNLELGFNQIGIVSKEFFCHLKNLTSLSLICTEIYQLEENFLSNFFNYLKNLEYLEIFFNNKSRQKLTPKVFNGLKKLKNLKIKYLKNDGNFQLDIDMVKALSKKLPNLNNVCVGGE